LVNKVPRITQPPVEPFRFDAEAALRATDALLDGVERLEKYSAEHWEAEYRECCGNARHSEQLRASIMGFWASFNGIIFVAVGVALNLLDKNPAVSFGLMTVIGIAGSFITIMVRAMESREMEYYSQFSQRCRILESEAGFYGQYWRTYLKLVRDGGKKSRVATMRKMYSVGAISWLVLSVLSLLALLMHIMPAQFLQQVLHAWRF